MPAIRRYSDSRGERFRSRLSDGRTLDVMGTFVTTRSEQVGPAARPVAIPEDLGTSAATRSSGRVVLSLRVRWSGPPRTYDLGELQDRLLVYEQVMTEGTDDDVRAFIDVGEMTALWDDLVLPRQVRRAWAEWL
jgi:hypothetical protein